MLIKESLHNQEKPLVFDWRINLTFTPSSGSRIPIANTPMV